MRSSAALPALVLALVLVGCGRGEVAPDPAFEALREEEKAYACSSSFWNYWRFDVPEDVLTRQCAASNQYTVGETRLLSQQFEQQELEYLDDWLEANVTSSDDLDFVDLERRCSLRGDDLRAEVEAWQATITFPSWEGVAYVPRVDHTIAMYERWQAGVCPFAT